VKKKLGRPRVPKKLARGTLLSVRFSETERLKLEQAAQTQGLRLSEWARQRILKAAGDELRRQGLSLGLSL
jgi:hypothetical protein